MYVACCAEDNILVIVCCSLGPSAFCRAYLNLLSHEDLYIFTEKFDGYVFVDSRGAYEIYF